MISLLLNNLNFIIMKKLSLLLSVCLVSSIAWGQSWIGNSYCAVNSTWYNGSGSGNPALPASLGSFTNNFTLLGQVQIWSKNSSSPATLYYSIDGGSFTAITLPYKQDVDNNSQFEGSASVDLSSLSPGNHSVSMYFQWGSLYDSNGGGNYNTSFTYSPVATGVDQVKTGAAVSVANKTIVAGFDGQANIQLLTVSGQIIENTVATDSFRKTVAGGAYILKVNGKSYKVMVP
jgi:hypothetical protein